MKTRPPDDCRAMLADVSAYLDGELGPEACRALARHCRTCPRCAGLVASLRRAVGLCRKAGAKPLPARVRARAREAMRRVLEQNGA
jgi:anti-sigma factor RsiW